jgi:hypothetical protein
VALDTTSIIDWVTPSKISLSYVFPRSRSLLDS